MLRLSFLVPFNISNYVLGASAVKFKDFAIGTLALFPCSVFFVYVGTTISTLEEAFAVGE